MQLLRPKSVSGNTISGMAAFDIFRFRAQKFPMRASAQSMSIHAIA